VNHLPKAVRNRKGADGEPDWAILVVAADRSVVDRLQATMQAAGHQEMRPPYGFVIRALAASKQMEAELRADLGDADVDAARRVLLRFIERHGRLEDALARRARPVW
jgi:hypothetical protein